jgi:hypothetical protein
MITLTFETIYFHVNEIQLAPLNWIAVDHTICNYSNRMITLLKLPFTLPDLGNVTR